MRMRMRTATGLPNTAPFAGSAENDPKKRLMTFEIMPTLPPKRVKFYLAPV